MKKLIVCVFDKKAEFFAPPVFVNSKGEAIRSFIDCVQSSNPQNTISVHPEDFDLFQIGEWNAETGVIDAFKSPVHLISALECVKKEGE